ncbi:MAG: hypothetical protein ACLPJW_04515, partial [Rhodomicrobium sp.]
SGVARELPTRDASAMALSSAGRGSARGRTSAYGHDGADGKASKNFDAHAARLITKPPLTLTAAKG